MFLTFIVVENLLYHCCESRTYRASRLRS